MNVRRSLGSALDVSEEKLAFISGKSLNANAEQPSGDASPAQPPTRAPRERNPRRSPRRNAIDDPAHAASEFGPPRWVPISTKLRPETFEALHRVCLERKLRRTGPNSVQEIVDAAISKWLTGNSE